MIDGLERSPMSRLRNTATVFLTAGFVALVGCGDVTIEGPDWCGGGGFCEPPSGAYQAQDSFEIRAEALAELVLRGEAGSVEILGSASATECVVEGVRRVRSHSLEDARSGLAELQVQVREVGGTLYVETRQPGVGRGRTYQVHYRVTVPDSVALTVEHGAGPVEVRSVRADVELRAAAGSVTLEDLHGNVHVTQAAGDIEVSTEVPPGGVIDLGNGAGDIRVVIPRQTSASLEAVSGAGRVRLIDLSVNDLDPRASVVRGTLGEGDGTIRVHTAAGDITITGTG